MKTKKNRAVVVFITAAMLMSALLPAGCSLPKGKKDIWNAAQEFFDAYASGDADAVKAMVDGDITCDFDKSDNQRPRSKTLPMSTSTASPVRLRPKSRSHISTSTAFYPPKETRRPKRTSLRLSKNTTEGRRRLSRSILFSMNPKESGLSAKSPQRNILNYSMKQRGSIYLQYLQTMLTISSAKLSAFMHKGYSTSL